jgi:glycerol-3-phosphate dehydrogenase
MQRFDVVVIGGGVSGLGVALAASQRRLSTLVLEKRSCAAATSNNTLRIIHGGFRYLQNGDIPRVIQSLCDQRDLINELPELITPLPCLMPLNRLGLKSHLPVACAALAYGGFMRLFRSPLQRPTVVRSSKIEELVPLLRNRAPHGALCWYDALMLEPLRIAEQLVSSLRKMGVTVLENSAALSVEKNGAGLFTTITSSQERFESRVVINTLGPWLDSLKLSADINHGPRPLWCKGFNLTINRQIDPTYGIGFEGRDGRLFFCTPRGTGTAIGTWYLPISTQTGESTHTTDLERDEFLAAFNDAVPGVNILPEEVVATDAGVLPMTTLTPRGPKLQAHEKVTNHDNYIEVVSTKYTTFRSQGRKVVAAITS